MKFTYELPLWDFDAGHGAKAVLITVKALGMCEKVENVLSECYPEGLSPTQLNDILRFEEEWIAQICGYEICDRCNAWFPADAECDCYEEDENDD